MGARNDFVGESMIMTTEGGFVAVATAAAIATVLSAYALRVAREGRPSEARLDGETGTPLLGRYPIEAFHWALRGVGRAIARTEVAPDTLTLVSLAFSVGTIPLTATGHFELAGLLLAIGCAFDAFDGIVARAQGVASDGGEMLDAVVDRYADAACLVGLAFFYRANILGLAAVLVALIGSMMVSYVRAKAESLHLALPQGLMRRPERIAYLCAGLVFGRVLSAWLFASDALRPVTLLVVLMVGVLSNISATHMMRNARVLLRARSLSGAK